MHFERQNAFQNAYNYIFSRKKILKKICVPTLPKIVRPVTRSAFILHYKALLINGTLVNSSDPYNNASYCHILSESALFTRSKNISNKNVANTE